MTFNKATIQGILDNPLGQTQNMNHRTFVKKAAVALLNFQTITEQLTQNTINENGVGFNAADGKGLTWFALAAKKGLNLNDHTIEKNAKRLRKYAGQLEKIAQKG